MTDEIITTHSFDELPADDASAWKQFDQMTDEESSAVEDPDNPPLHSEQRKQFRRTYFIRGEKVREDEKTLGETFEEKGETPILIPVDADIAKWFKVQGGDYQVRINAVLRNYLEVHRS